MSTLGFEIAKTGLNVARYQMNVVGNNIANVSTPGYSRQQAIQVTAGATHSLGIVDYRGHGVSNQGVKIQTIQRIRNEFLDSEYRNSLSSTNYNYHMSEAYLHIEDIINEPSDNALNSMITNLFNSLSEISSKPADLSARTTFTESVNSFTSTLNSMGKSIDNLQYQYSQDLNGLVSKINSLTKEIYDLNKEIQTLDTLNNPANDLKDSRDYAIDELSKLIDIDVYTGDNGVTSILAGGKLLVGANTHKELSIEADPDNSSYKVLWSDELDTFKMTGGQLKATLDVMNNVLPSFENSLNNLASSFSKKFNEIHMQGFDLNGNAGVEFFVSKDGEPININNISINSDILNDEALLAFSKNATLSGDNSNLKDLMDLKNEKIITLDNGNTMTIGEFYNYTVSKVGLQSSSYNQAFENNNLTLESVYEQKLSVSSVSLDEETANLMQYQQTYNACSKLLQTIDEMLQTLIDIV